VAMSPASVEYLHREELHYRKYSITLICTTGVIIHKKTDAFRSNFTDFIASFRKKEIHMYNSPWPQIFVLQWGKKTHLI